MAFKEYRGACKDSSINEFDIERFAYDVFAYMLRICGFPEKKIPTSDLKDNVYIEDDFVMNVGLSALPIALYSRDDWRFVFEENFGESENYNILEIQNYFESYVAYSGEFEEEDTLSQIQFSLALYNEYILFLEFKGTENCFGNLPKLWSRLCRELIAQSEELDGVSESSLTMCPGVAESWIRNFITDFAFPYGASADVADRFSLFILECHTEENDNSSEETSKKKVADAVPRLDGLESCSRTISPNGSDCQELGESEEYLGSRPILKENKLVNRKPQLRHKNGLKYVIDKCLKGTKRRRSPKLEIEDAIGRINFEKENVSPENPDTKRRRASSGKDAQK